jgi:hypothetical protein
MALRDFGQQKLVDPIVYYSNGSWSPSNQKQLSATNTKLAVMIQSPQAGTITDVGIALQGCTTSATVRVSLQTLTTDVPSGTYLGGSTYGTFTPALGPGYYNVTLPTSASGIAAGMKLAVVLEWDSTQGSLEWACGQASSSITYNVPYGFRYAGGWTNNYADKGLYCGHVKFQDGTFPRTGLLPFTAASSSTITVSSSTSPNEYGIQFTPQQALRVIGGWHFFTVPAGADYALKLYQGTTVLQSVTKSASAQAQPSAVAAMTELLFSPQVLAAGTTYTLAYTPSTTTAANVWTQSVYSPASVQALGLPAAWNVAGVSRAGGAWTLLGNTLVIMGVIFDQIDDGSGTPAGVGLSRVFGGF